VFLVLAGVVAAVDWWAVVTDTKAVEYVCKPLTLVLLIGVAVTLTPADSTVRAWFVAGLVLSLAGDVFLMLPQDLFIPGLVSFLLGHIAYVVGLLQYQSSRLWLVVGLGAVLIGTATVGTRIRMAVKRGEEPELTVPVTVYMGVISAMVLAAFGSAVPFTIGGALLFYASDATLAWNRFVHEHPRGRVAVMTTYHLGQAGLVLGLL
jgi:uncharacterized membrane protein YhhN